MCRFTPITVGMADTHCQGLGVHDRLGVSTGGHTRKPLSNSARENRCDVAVDARLRKFEKLCRFLKGRVEAAYTL